MPEVPIRLVLTDDHPIVLDGLQRLFQSQTGLSFGGWRQQARLLEAMGRLGRGAPVTQVALDLGYDSVSAFSAMFRRAAGASPSAYRHRP